MLKYIYALLLLTFYACSEEKPTMSTESDTMEQSFYPENYNWDTLKGIYRSKTDDADLFLNLDFSSPAHITGYSLFKGLKRNISGKVEIKGDSIFIVANEPGDLDHDGQFVLLFDPENVDLTGYWKINKGNRKIELLLKKQHYDSDFEWGDPLSKGNLSTYLGTLSSKYGELYFQFDGSVKMEYYPLEDSGEVSQLEIYNGGWTLEKGKVHIDWKNTPSFLTKRTHVRTFMSPEGMDSIQLDTMRYFPFYW